MLLPVLTEILSLLWVGDVLLKKNNTHTLTAENKSVQWTSGCDYRGLHTYMILLIFVTVYEIPSGRVLAAYNGHLKVVYDLCWSSDDRSLLSASSDGTVK